MGVSTHSLLRRRKVFYGWWVLLAASLGAFCVTGAGPFTLTVLIKPMTEDLSWSQSELLGALTTAALLSAVVAPFLGRLVDRHGARASVTLSLFLLGAMLAVTAHISALWQFYLVYTLGLGVAMSGVWQVGSAALAARWFIRKRGIAYAVIAVAMSGVPFALVAQSILDLSDWRWVWRIIGLFVIAVPTPLAWLVIRNSPEDRGLQPDGGVSRPLVAEQQQVPRERDPRVGGVAEVSWTLKEASRTRTFWLLNGSLSMLGFPGSGVLTAMHPYFTDLGVSSGTAAVLVNFYGFTGLLGAVIGGMLIQRWSARALRVPYIVTYAVALALFVLVGSSPSVLLLYLSLTSLGITFTGLFLISNQVWADYYGRREIGSILGLHSLARSVPMALGALISAGVHDLTGSYRPAFTIYVGLCLVAAVGLFFAKPPRKMESREADSL